jgi:hypothetical protein
LKIRRNVLSSHGRKGEKEGGRRERGRNAGRKKGRAQLFTMV